MCSIIIIVFRVFKLISRPGNHQIYFCTFSRGPQKVHSASVCSLWITLGHFLRWWRALCVSLLSTLVTVYCTSLSGISVSNLWREEAGLQPGNWDWRQIPLSAVGLMLKKKNHFYTSVALTFLPQKFLNFSCLLPKKCNTLFFSKTVELFMFTFHNHLLRLPETNVILCWLQTVSVGSKFTLQQILIKIAAVDCYLSNKVVPEICTFRSTWLLVCSQYIKLQVTMATGPMLQAALTEPGVKLTQNF